MSDIQFHDLMEAVETVVSIAAPAVVFYLLWRD